MRTNTIFLSCLKCGYKWIPRKADRPKECPECKRRNWDVPPADTGRGEGRARGRRVAGRHGGK